MQKDVIYIDVEDDITAIIGKLKAAKHEVVALVPPKRIGVLQSAVNLRLLARSASNHKKYLVLVTNNHALASLAASAKIPVAKNLQSKPGLAAVVAADPSDDEDIIDGTELETTDSSLQSSNKSAAAAALGAAAIMPNESVKDMSSETATLADVTSKKAPKVPNFDTFRKKVLIIGALAVLLIGGLIWALVFAPHAKVVLKTRTTNAAINQPVTLGPNVITSFEKTSLKTEIRELKKDISISFDATGKKEVGEKASGTVKFSQQSLSSETIPAGTQLTTSGGLVFVTTAAVTVPASTVGPGCFPTACAGSATGSVTAAKSGSSYNAATGSLSGSGMSANFTSPTAGGTDKTVSVVTQADVDGAKQKVNEASTQDQAKKDLMGQFGSEYTVLTETMKADSSNVKPSVGVDGEASDGKAVLGGSVTYSLQAIKHDQLDTYLTSAVTSQIDNTKEQRVYDNGLKAVKITNVRAANDVFRADLATNGKVGPTIDEQKVKDIAKGKGYGEVQSQLNAMNGVEDVDVQFSPFWVRSVPNDTKKITVEFILNDS